MPGNTVSIVYIQYCNMVLSGYRASWSNPDQCFDMNECYQNDGMGKCVNAARCVNLDGSFRCECGDGFILAEDKLTCFDVPECETNNGGCSHTCIEEQGSYSCSCPSGFELGRDKKQCHDKNECNDNKGGCDYSCENTPGSYICICQRGNVVDTDGKSCVDLDEVRALLLFEVIMYCIV